MNTNLPLVPRTGDGPTWSNGWAATGAHLDMIAKQYKNGTRMGKERGKNGKKGGKNGLERGKKRVGTGAKTGFKRYKKWNLAKFENLERRRTAVLRCSTSFQPFFGRSASFFTRFSRFWPETGKKRVPKNGGTGKERTRFFPVSFLFPFFTFPFLAPL